MASTAEEGSPLQQFCAGLKALRTESGLTCERLARLMTPDLATQGKSASTGRVNEIENGRNINRAPNLDLVLAWVRACRAEAARQKRPLSVSTDLIYWEKRHERLVAELAPAPRWRRQTSRSSPAQRLHHLLHSRPTPQVDEDRRLPSYYLDPARRVAGFVARPELVELRQWCEQDTAQTVRLVHGPGGAGKTRLSIELGALLDREPDWFVGHLTSRPLGDLDALADALAGVEARVLLCVDYAEDWAYELPKFLARMAGARLENVRILLLARTVGAWWRTLTSNPDVGHLVDSEPIRLGEIHAGTDRRELLTLAYRDFYAAVFDRPPKSMPTVLASEPAGDQSILGMHAAALSVVLHEKEHGEPPPRIDPLGPLHAVLGHERRWWAKWLRAQNAAMDPAHVTFGEIVDRILAVPALYLAADVSQAERALAIALDGFPVSEVFKSHLAATLHEVYPSSVTDRYWDPLRPDRLGETLVLDTAATAGSTEYCVDTVCRPFTETVTTVQAVHTLLVLTRASDLAAASTSAGNPTLAQERTIECIRTLLHQFPEVFIPASSTIVAGLANPEPMIEIIRPQIRSASSEAARLAAEHLPATQEVLAPLEVALWQHHLDTLGTDASANEIGYAHYWLGEAHERAGAAEAALVAARAAVEYYVQAVGSGRHDLLASLADARSALASRADEAGLHEEADNQITRAIDDYQDLIGSGQEHHLRSLYWAEAFKIRSSKTRPTFHQLEVLYEHEDALRRELNDFLRSNMPHEVASKLVSESYGPLLAGSGEAILVPVGHSVGPLFTDESGRPDSYEIRYADGIFGIDHEELRVWALAHGDPATINEDPPCRERVHRKATEMDAPKVTEVVDRLVEFGLVVELPLNAEQMQKFAYTHQVDPLAVGLGNTPETPHYFQIGLPGAPRVNVGHDAYHLWMFAHRHASLWDAVEYVVSDRRRESVARSGSETDPNQVLKHFIDALPALLATSCAYVDRVR
ncbi:hypothetical protein [Actinophytocola sp.]|uniref:hypothetical protein n=1 Tax=Actinophytocola sp. TaxID=1872138 RepID=UPI003D6AFD80